jgi:hypothetical protein
MDSHDHVFDDRTPGVEAHEPTASILSYTAGLGLAILATIGSFILFPAVGSWQNRRIRANPMA